MADDLKDDDVKELDDMCMLANSRMGRPKVWTEEAIKKFADELTVWAKLKTSLVLCVFANDKDYDADILGKLARMSPYFRRALKGAKRIIGARRETGAICKKLDSKVFGMSQRMYDPDYDAYRYAELQREERIKAEERLAAARAELDLLSNTTMTPAQAMAVRGAIEAERVKLTAELKEKYKPKKKAV